MARKSAVVIFGDSIAGVVPEGTVIANERVKQSLEIPENRWENLSNFIEPGSIYEASALLEELAMLKLPDGRRVAKLCIYKGYELWWMRYNALFLHFCLPYTAYKKLLEHLCEFDNVTIYHPPEERLFRYYLEAYGHAHTIRAPHSAISFGGMAQIALTLVSIPALMLWRRNILVFTGDKFEKGTDHDFRMRYIYEELRRRGLPFVECIRSLERWPNVLRHAWKRKRPVLYSEAIGAVARGIAFATGGSAHSEVGPYIWNNAETPLMRFKYRVACHSLEYVRADIWHIRVMQLLLRALGIKAAFIAAALERNIHTVLACKLSGIKTVGILHGVASRFYNGYDFLPGFDGTNRLSVDMYGLWSEWWREYYMQYSKTYTKEQLVVSGLMRPLQKRELLEHKKDAGNPIKVLFVPGALSSPEEVLPYLEALADADGISLYLTFRPYRDAFEEWIQKRNPALLEKIGNGHLFRGRNIQQDIADCDVVVGSYSTAVLEALLQSKPPIFFETRKWGDYFGLSNYGQMFYARSPKALVEAVRGSVAISESILSDLRERFFGDPFRNGSAWAVDRLEEALNRRR